ncbi:hypothetical protein [Acinetobacter towneri]|uniref:hypothetical protein n=1 Tax=Acinetobacter towneri TaxID=202956 RepID=UPI0034D72C2B
MSNLVTVISKIYDASGKYVINLNVKSRYKGSSRENSKKTDKEGLFIFQGSPNRTVEILAKPPNAKDYIVIKTLNSSLVSSRNNPLKVFLPKSIEEYRKEKITPSSKGIVTTLFKVIDCNEKVLINFPVKSRPKGRQSSFERTTDEQGIVEVLSSPNRDIEILVLNLEDKFVLKSTINSENGSQTPIIIKLDEPYENFISKTFISLLDRNHQDYVVENTKVEIVALGTQTKKILSISNGKIPVQSRIGEKIQITVFKPDGSPLSPETYLVKSLKQNNVKLVLDVDVIKGNTVEGKPVIDKTIGNINCSDKCTVKTVSFMTKPGPYIISMETWKKILEFERYEAKPYHPGDRSSGVTLGIGYDLGQQSKSQIYKDLSPFYSSEQIKRLLEAQGKSGSAAAALVPKLIDIRISKEKALHLATALKTRYAQQVLTIYPKTLELHPHCQGVLLSLVFNRGISLNDRKGQLTRKHMRQIKEAFENNKVNTIPNIFRDMSKLWTKTGPSGNSGVGRRRREEAVIFERGLKCECYK